MRLLSWGRGVWGLAGLLVLASAAPAQANWPGRPVRVIVPFPASGATDLVARVVTQRVAADLGQQLVVDNKPGAGGTLGTAEAAKAAPDGYTGELIAYAKAHPGEVTYGSPGSGASPHVSGALFQSMTGAQISHIPYKGSAPAMSDLLGNQIAIMFDNMPSAIQHVRSGKLRPIAVTTAKRSPELPDVPTIAEAGVPGYEATSWFGLWAVAGTPAPILTKLQTALTKVLKDPAVAKKIADQGGEVVIETPAQFDAFIKSEAAKWGKVVKESGAEV